MKHNAYKWELRDELIEIEPAELARAEVQDNNASKKLVKYQNNVKLVNKEELIKWVQHLNLNLTLKKFLRELS